MTHSIAHNFPCLWGSDFLFTQPYSLFNCQVWSDKGQRQYGVKDWSNFTFMKSGSQIYLSPLLCQSSIFNNFMWGLVQQTWQLNVSQLSWEDIYHLHEFSVWIYLWKSKPKVYFSEWWDNYEMCYRCPRIIRDPKSLLLNLSKFPNS